jgi:hypothetical protein
MLEYTYEEAMKLLESNLTAAIAKRAETEEDIEYLKDQITTTEVNTARVYNFEKHRRWEEEKKATAAASGTAPATGSEGK